MPSTATPPPPPPAVSYPPPPPPGAVAPAPPAVGGHGHLNGAKIGLIAGGGVAVIGGIVAVIALTGHHTPSTPPPAPAPVQPVNNQPTTPPTQPSQPTQPTQPSSPSTPDSPAPESPTPESSQPAQPSDSGGSAIDLGNGVSLTPASGWKVEGTGHNQVALLGPNSNAEYFAAGGAAKEQDAAAQLQDDAQSYVSSDSALSGVKVGQAQTQSVSGSAGFTQVATMPFTATLTTNQGTAQILGLFYELLNPQGYSVLVVFDATSEDAYKAAAPDSDSMTSSLLGGSG